MLEKLQKLEDEYNDIQDRMADPGVIANQSEYQKLVRKYKQLEHTVELFAELKKAKTKKAETDAAERKKLMNAVTFTDIPATIIKAGFHSDDSPRLAIAELFSKNVKLDHDNENIKYLSKGLSVELGEIRYGSPLSYAPSLSMLSSLILFFNVFCFNSTPPEVGHGFFIGMLIAGILPIFLVIVVGFAEADSGKLKLTQDNWVKIKLGISTEVPLLPRNVLSQITGRGPFAILFEVTEGWEEIEPDPVIFRVINIGDKQFFEPVVGYDMTPLEKKSLVPT